MIYQPIFYTTESVTAGHPDKICDQISDAILDECLRQDPQSRVAVECFGSHGLLIIGGEITTRAVVDYATLAQKVYAEIGYNEPLKVEVNIVQQSPEIAASVDEGGAGDQGIMYGYATAETERFLHRGVVLAHQLTYYLEQLRRNGKLPYLRPDGKAEVTLVNGQVRTIVVSAQHEANTSQEQIKQDLIRELISALIEEKDTQILINPTGQFVQGGFQADTGLTGRKIMVDSYGGLIPHGGGCFSGKDATKVDRSGAYMARFASKNIVANGWAKECLVSVAYAIGRAEPVMVGAIDEAGKDLSAVVKKHFDFRPLAIIERLNLRQPIFAATAAYGHFGRAGFSWEEIVKL